VLFAFSSILIHTQRLRDDFSVISWLVTLLDLDLSCDGSLPPKNRDEKALDKPSHRLCYRRLNPSHDEIWMGAIRLYFCNIYTVCFYTLHHSQNILQIISGSEPPSAKHCCTVCTVGFSWSSVNVMVWRGKR